MRSAWTRSASAKEEGKDEGNARRTWLKALRPAATAAAALGLVAGVLGVDPGLAGAKGATSVHRYAAYVGGHGKAHRKRSPITIGVVNQQTGTNAVAPEWTTGAEIAVKYLNHHTGGIDGHPVKMVLCKIATSVADASSCGQEFADNRAISAVSSGPIFVGNTALESALSPSRKPIFFGVSLSGADEKDKNAYILFGTVTGVEAPMATFAKKYLHVKSVSITYQNIPAELEGANIVKKALKREGVQKVYVSSFPTTETNLTEPFNAAHVGSTTLTIAVNSGGPACSDTYKTLESLHVTTKVLTNVPCDTPTVAKADGGQLPPGWYYASVDPLAGSGTPAVKAFERVATKYGHKTTGPNAWVADSFGQILTIAKFDTEILKAHKKIDPATLRKKAKAFRGPVVQGAPHLHCGGFAGTPAVCDDLVSFFHNTGPGVMKDVAPWLAPPKGSKG